MEEEFNRWEAEIQLEEIECMLQHRLTEYFSDFSEDFIEEAKVTLKIQFFYRHLKEFFESVLLLKYLALLIVVDSLVFIPSFFILCS